MFTTGLHSVSYVPGQFFKRFFWQNRLSKTWAGYIFLRKKDIANGLLEPILLSSTKGKQVHHVAAIQRVV